ncbi:MAG: hypothetical protein HY897_20130 [Deltaproteobacteria bacterium]|nr:hypothetical protein [Deltaproteobacteria bacterium]
MKPLTTAVTVIILALATAVSLPVAMAQTGAPAPAPVPNTGAVAPPAESPKVETVLLTSPRVYSTPKERFASPSRFAFSLSTNALSSLQFGPSVSAEAGADVGVVIRYLYPPKGLIAQKITDPAALDRGYGISAGLRWYLSGRCSVKGFHVGVNGMYAVVEGTYMNEIPGMYGSDSIIDGYIFHREFFAPYLDLGYRWIFFNHLMVGVGGALGFAFTMSNERERFDGRESDPVESPPMPYSEINLDIGVVY